MQRGFYRIAIIFIVFIQVAACSSSKHSKSRLPGTWQAQPITIDGSNKDWPSPYPEYDDKAMLGYAVSNDKENLYITVETGDPATQLKILKEGLTVWIDKTGKKEEVTGVNYPIPAPRETESRKKEDKPPRGQWQQGNGSGQDKKRMELEDKVRKALEDANEYSLQGFKSCNLQYPLMERDSCGVVVRIGLDADNELVWEAVVPFSSFYFKHEIDKRDKGKPLSICIEATGMKRPAGQSGGGGGGRGGGGGIRPSVGMGGMGMRMGGGGGMHRGGGGGGGSQNNTMMEPAYKTTKTYKRFGIGWQE